MVKQVILEAEVRADQGKEKVKKLRTKGMIPAVFYGKGIANLNLTVNAKDFLKAVKSSEAKLNSLFNLKIKAKDKVNEEIVFVRQFMQNPMTDEFMHLDFMKVNTKEAIETKVKVKLVGESPAVKQGLMLQLIMHELPIKCLPLDIPTIIEIDVTKLENAHDAVRVKDLKSDKYTIELPTEQQIIRAEVPREIKIEETTGPVSAEVPTTVQGAPAEEGKEGAKEGEAKGKTEAKPEAKAEAKPDAKAAAAKTEKK